MRLNEILVEKRRKQNNNPVPVQTQEPDFKLESYERHDLFVKTLKKYSKGNNGLMNKLDSVLKTKMENSRARMGGNDRPFTGLLKGYDHLHLSRNPDLVLIYKIVGKTIHFLAIASHDETDNRHSATALKKKLQHMLP